VVYFARAQSTINRTLAILLFFEGTAAGGLVAGMRLIEGLPERYAVVAVSNTADIMVPPLYLLFLAVLDSPLTAPFRRRTVRLGVAAYALAAEAFWLARPALFIGPDFVVGRSGGLEPRLGFGYNVAVDLIVVTSLFGFVASLDALRRGARASLARRRARGYAIAFGTRDFLVAFLVIGVFRSNLLNLPTSFVAVGYYPTLVLTTVLFHLLLCWAILRFQLFDIEVRLRSGIAGGAVATTFLLAFLVVSQLVQNLSGSTLGPVVGAVAAGLLLFAIQPIQDAAQNLARVAVGRRLGIQALPEVERADLYMEQVRIAWEDGVLSKDERRMLDAVRAKLYLSHEQARVLEDRVLSAAPAA
jgi:hypothetical protein